MARRLAITIGNFDGVHLGHQALIRRARELRPGGRVLAMAFDPHPLTWLAPAHAPGRLTTFQRRAELLRQAGADDVVRLEPTGDLLSSPPRRFVEHVIREHAPDLFVEGPDFHFGRDRQGNVSTLALIGAELGFDVDVVPPFEVALDDQTLVTASSTITRWLIENGRVSDAIRVLGRPYEIEGQVVPGDRRGRDLGFPTANVDSSCLLPADGIYAGRALLPSGRRLAAAIHVGQRPTFDADDRTLEAFILDWPDPAADDVTRDYGWTLRLEIRHWLRDQIRFESPGALVDQIERDVDRTRALLAPAESPQEAPV